MSQNGKDSIQKSSRGADPGDPEREDGRIQRHVNRFFDASAPYWDDVYRGDSLQDVIYQQRQAAVLEYVEQSELPPRATALEIGCGAGHLTLALAERGLRVVATDASQAMVDVTARRAQEAHP